MSKTAIVLLADGFEEIEATTVLDVLRRAEIETLAISVSEKNVVTGARGISIVADRCLEDISGSLFDLIVLPGGMPGTDNLRENELVEGLIHHHHINQKHIAAICAAPYVLGELGILDGKKATSYPTFQNRLGNADVVDESVVVDGNLITSQGVGTALEFSLKIVSILKSSQTAKELGAAMIVSQS